MSATDSTGSRSPGNLVEGLPSAAAADFPSSADAPLRIEYGRGGSVPPECIPVAVGWATLLAGVYYLCNVWLVTGVLVPMGVDRAPLLRPMALMDLVGLAEPAGSFVLIPAGIALIRNHRWPYPIIAIWSLVVLAGFSLFYGPTIWSVFAGPRQFDLWQLLDRLSVLSAAIYPVFAVVFFFGNSEVPERLRRRAIVALSVAGLLAGLSRIGEGRFGKMGFYLLPRAIVSWDFSDRGDWLVQTGIAIAYLAIGVLTFSAAIRLLLRRRQALNLMRWTEWAYVMLLGLLFSRYARAFHWQLLSDPWYRLNTIYGWFGSLHGAIYPTLALLLFHAVGDEPVSRTEAKRPLPTPDFLHGSI